ncbi:MAG: amidohydrolase family protein [Candidatus Atribacteria bacterium]|nr:amidohydrolase family protein [Candidatus Atribacteria bacterium]
MNPVFQEIFGQVQNIEIIDTHEHLPYSEEVRIRESDFLKEYLSHYLKSDLISAGLRATEFHKIDDLSIPLMDRWEIVKPYWEYTRYTGYGQALDLSVKALYGIDSICTSTVDELNRCFLASLRPGHYEYVLKEKSKIKISLLDNNLFYGKNANLDCDRNYFRSVFLLDDFILLDSWEIIHYVEQQTGIRICSFDNWLEACERMFHYALDKGAVALKTHLAYRRSLRFERFTKSEAESEFNEIFTIKNYPEWEKPVYRLGKKFQDYMMHFILGQANRSHLTFQVHTGIQEGNGNQIANSNPELLNNLFLEYPDINFDIFHIGYPYQQVVSVLAKNFPNVFIDMCWAHIVSPVASINALSEWLEAVPYNKISAFGGDYLFVDGVFGAQLLARINVCKVLAQKVETGLFDIDRAITVARMLFYENPWKLFNLGITF